MGRFCVIDHNGKHRAYMTWRGAHNGFGMAGWKQAKTRGDAAKDAWADDQLRFDRVSEWDVRRLGSIHIDGITIKSMIA